MNLLKTQSFTLATYARGGEASHKVALVLPGRLDSKDYPHMHSHVDYLAERGYYALSFDPPGTWESPGGIELYNITNYLKAINELIEQLGNRPTLLLGHSRGGSMAMSVGCNNPKVTAFVAIMSRTAGSMPLDEAAAKEVSYRDTPPDDRAHQVKFELPHSYFEDAAQFDAAQDLPNCPKPKLFILGTKDNLITPESVREMYALASQPKELVEVISDHDYRRQPAVIEEINDLIGQFLLTNQL